NDRALLLRFLEVVVGIDISDVEWTIAVHLDYGAHFREGVVVRFGGQEMEAAGSERMSLAGLDLVARAQIKRSGDHGEVVFSVEEALVVRSALSFRVADRGCKNDCGKRE